MFRQGQHAGFCENTGALRVLRRRARATRRASSAAKSVRPGETCSLSWLYFARDGAQELYVGATGVASCAVIRDESFAFSVGRRGGRPVTEAVAGR